MPEIDIRLGHCARCVRLRVQHRCLEQHLDRTRATDCGVATSITARVRFEPKIADPGRAQRSAHARSEVTAPRETLTWAQLTSVQREGSIHDRHALSRYLSATIVDRTGKWCDAPDCRHGVYIDEQHRQRRSPAVPTGQKSDHGRVCRRSAVQLRGERSTHRRNRGIAPRNILPVGYRHGRRRQRRLRPL